jgi:hypothetical protein
MLGFGTTAGKIDDFEARFTMVNGAHFLIARDGKQAWPITATEAETFKARYRGRMMWARWIRRITIGVPILLILFGNATWLPQPVRAAFGVIATVLILCALTFGIQQHIVVSFVTKLEIERALRHRIATGMRAAITPSLTPLGRLGRRLLFAGIAMEVGLGLLHLLLGPTIFAEWLGITAWLGETNVHRFLLQTLAIGWIARALLLLAILMLIVDRWIRRKTPETRAAAIETPGR